MGAPLRGSQSSIAESPLAAELAELFAAIPADDLINSLQKTVGRGPKGYAARSLFNCFVASYYLNCDSIADTVRRLQDNPSLAEACGFTGRLPSRPTLSRFFSRLTARQGDLAQIAVRLTDCLKERLPNFGQNVAVDSTTVRTHSNPDHKPVSDPEASWTAKGYKVGSTKKQWHFGYKYHMLVDATYELPIAGYTTTASESDSQNLVPLLEQAKSAFDWFQPEAVIADKGYDSQANSKAVIDDFHAAPIIPLRDMRQGAVNRRSGTKERILGVIPRWSEEWRSLYARRTSVERTFGRLKERRRLEKHCYRGLAKITMHCLLAVITMQAKFAVQLASGGPTLICLRRVA